MRILRTAADWGCGRSHSAYLGKVGDSWHPRCEKDTLLFVPLPKSQGDGSAESWLARDLSREGGGRKRFFPEKLIRACKEGLLPPRERETRWKEK